MNNNNNASHLYCAQKCKTNSYAQSFHIGKTHDQHLEAHAEAFPPARQGTILNSHRVIGIATNTSMVLNCALVTGCSLNSYPGHN